MTRKIFGAAQRRITAAMTAEEIIRRCSEMMPEWRWVINERLMEMATKWARFFDSLDPGASTPKGVIKTSDGQPTDAWWNLVGRLLRPHPTIWDEPGFEDLAGQADDIGKLNEFVAYAKRYWQEGVGFMRSPLEIFDEWMLQAFPVIEF